MIVDNHTHIRRIMLYHFEKVWKAEQSFPDGNKLFCKETISESRCREWFTHFKLATLAWKISQEEVDQASVARFETGKPFDFR